MNFADREFEVKFATDAAGLAAAWNAPALGAPAPAPRRLLTSVYFDTAERDLSRNGLSLRLRRSGRSAPVLTFKWRAPSAEGPFARGEIEVRHPAGPLELGRLGEFAAAEIAKAIQDRTLAPQFETRVRRRVRRLSVGGAEIEAAFDEGEIVAGARSAPMTELELERIGGEPSDFYAFASEVASHLPLRLEALTKARRGFLLCDAARPAPVKAGDARIPEAASFDDAAALLIGDTLRHFLANLPALNDGDDPEAIHQMRVALRRMRALLALFHREAPCGEFVSFRAEAKRIAGALGPARECDAFAGLVAEGPGAEFGADRALVPLDTLIAARRTELHEAARRLVAAPETTQFVLRLQAFLARRGWRNALSAEDLPRLAEPAREFAVKALERLHRRALSRGKGLAEMPDEGRHELRIALKNLRYATEAFGDLFAPAPQWRAYARGVSRLQDLLGAHNDAAGARSFLHSLGADARPDTAFAAGLTLGWLGGGAAAADRELIRAWKAFKNAGGFWQ